MELFPSETSEKYVDFFFFLILRNGLKGKQKMEKQQFKENLLKHSRKS